MGFKFSIVSDSFREFILLSVGYSHLVKVKVPKICRVEYVARRKFFLSSTCLQTLTCFVNFLQGIKLPDRYKGKGLKFKYKVSLLKEGKKK